MNVLIIAGIGVVIVLAAVLWLRLHPLLALLCASLFLLVATPIHVRQRNAVESEKLSVEGLAVGGFIGLAKAVPPGDFLLWSESQSLDQWTQIRLERATPSQLSRADQRGELSPVNLVWYSVRSPDINLSKGDQLVAESAVRSLEVDRFRSLGSRLTEGFARTFRKLGIPVTMAAIVGICLLESGAAARLVAAIMALFGPRGTAPALTFSGFVLGIPVFFDNVFYLLLPLAKAVGKARPAKYLTAVMAIVVGATMAHSLVPPTPGPLFVADTMGVGIGFMMVGGFIVGSIAASFGFCYGALCNRFISLAPPEDTAAENTSDERRKVPLLLAALPIGLPILFLGGSEFVEYLASARETSLRLQQLNANVAIFNDPTLVFISAAIVAIAILRFYSTTECVMKSVAKGLSDAGTIVLLTSAGGAFGASLQQLNIASAIGEQFTSITTPWGMLFTAFLLTSLIRAAQGSATVAMLTSSAIIAPVVETMDLPFHTLYVALAIGCGSKPLPWMNDSGFWQVATMTGMTTQQTLKTFTVALTIMGVVGFGITLLGAWLFPLV